MRFFNYINEETLRLNNSPIELDDFIEILKKDCHYYINNFLNNKVAFFKGTFNNDKVTQEELHSNRRPQGTPPAIYDYVND